MSETQDPGQIAEVAPDVAPLAWVLGEIRTALAQATANAQTFLGAKGDVEPLRAARAQIHQANGALQMLNLRGVVQVLDAVEQLLRRWEAEPRECLPAAVRSVESTLSAVVAYLEAMLAGRPNQPVRLFPYYREILVLSRAPRVHAADLIFPDLSRRPAFHSISIRPMTADQLRVRRVHFESGLLGFLRNPNDVDARGMMRDALLDLENLPQRGLARSFWWIVRGMMDALAADHLPIDVDLKRVLARLNLQLRRLIEGSSAVAERLMIDALYYVGRAAAGEARVAEIKRLYGLDALIPPDFERATLTSIDQEQLRTLKEALAQAKAQWSPLAGGLSNDATKFVHEIQLARKAAHRIGAHAIDIVLDTVGSLAADIGTMSPSARETLGIEIASALLFADLGIEELPHTEPLFESRARQVAERLVAARNDQPLPDLGPWLTELARKAQDRLTMSTVVAETQATLREVEQRLDRFFRQPAERAELAATPPMLDQIAGVLSLLGHDDPVAAIRNAQSAIERFARPDAAPSQQEFLRIANNLGAVGFFVETLSQDADRPRGMFRWDADAGVFSADLAIMPIEAAREGEMGPITRMGGAPGENVESAARRHVEQAHALAQRLASGDTTALREFDQVLPQLTNDADLLDDDALKQRAARAAVLVRQLHEVRNANSVAELLQIFAPPPVAAPAPAPAPLPATEAAADAELLGIFVEEANEVLDTIDAQLARLAATPADQATLTTTRRAFHTLKGSSRMVGLKSFGEGAWSIEQCFNLWLSQERPASDDLIKLASAARTLMRGWIAQIAANPQAPIDSDALVRAANRVREGGPFSAAGLGLPEAAPAPVAAAPVAPAPAEEAHEEHVAVDVPEFEFEIPAPAAAAAPVEAPLAAEPEPIAADEVKRIGPVAVSHGLYSVFLNESDECIRTLAQDVSEWRYEPQRPASAQAARRAHSLAGITSTVGVEPVLEIADPLDDLLHELSGEAGAHVTLAPPQFDTLERAIERMRGMLHQFAAGIYPDRAPLDAAAVQDLLSVVRAQAALHLPAAEEEESPAEEAAPAPVTAPEPMAIAPVAAAAAQPAEEVKPAEEGAAAAETAALLGQIASTAPLEEPRPAAPAVRDELDPDLLPVFLTEGSELLPAIGARLRALAARPNDRDVARELMRQLHTVKGSARMAGAMRLGEVVHDMETRIEASMHLADVPADLIEDLHTAYDHALGLFDGLQSGIAPAQAAAPAAAQPVAPMRAAEAAAPEEITATMAAPAAAPTANYIRVRADVLDKLVDHAGEVSIARAKLENEVTTLRGAIVDLTENIQRLRSQLREVEIQADAQIQARSDQLSRESAAFDPLEYDRYTRLQELTRMLRETVEDVAMVQGSMLKGVQLADSDLTSQGRLTRELQQQLMRVRLVTFANISERLYRVARQAAKELDKRVNLDIRGANTEIDRGVLEKMGAPFEHLVRNAIAHGLETPAQRRAAGKPETGELKIDVRQEANEIIVVIADDGAGLNLERIRARAIERKLIAPDQPVSERDLMELIFAPGFTTATEVTELAGRGVGMDVVRSELGSFGGRIAVSTEAGRGTRFTLYLPLTLAVMQAVLARVGQRRFALPSGMVEQVLRFRPSEIGRSIGEGMIEVPGVGPVVLRPLAQLLGEEITLAHVKQIPVVVLKSGDDRLAIAVDDVSNNQEIVVKTVGASVSRLAGILGATILGNGEIVLIINPVQLIMRAPEPPTLSDARFAPQAGEGGAEGATEIAAATPAQVMVVDDSLTVRRVTQRLLERHGYEVLQAKDGVDALRQLQDLTPDLMLVDIEMPRMDGFELTRNVRGHAAMSGIPIIMITSRTAEKHRRMAFDLGVNEYLGKPYQEDELLALMRRYLAQRKQRVPA